jgi:hypothetical protein
MIVMFFLNLPPASALPSLPLGQRFLAQLHDELSPYAKVNDCANLPELIQNLLGGW